MACHLFIALLNANLSGNGTELNYDLNHILLKTELHSGMNPHRTCLEKNLYQHRQFTCQTVQTKQQFH